MKLLWHPFCVQRGLDTAGDAGCGGRVCSRSAHCNAFCRLLVLASSPAVQPSLCMPPLRSNARQGVDNLFERLERMASYGPTFCDITWGAGGTTADVTLDIATRMQNKVCALGMGTGVSGLCALG